MEPARRQRELVKKSGIQNGAEKSALFCFLHVFGFTRPAVRQRHTPVRSLHSSCISNPGLTNLHDAKLGSSEPEKFGPGSRWSSRPILAASLVAPVEGHSAASPGSTRDKFRCFKKARSDVSDFFQRQLFHQFQTIKYQDYDRDTASSQRNQRSPDRCGASSSCFYDHSSH